MEQNSIDIVKNRNISNKDLGHKGLHLKPQGNARLLLNLQATIRKLGFKFGNRGNPGYQSNVKSVSSDHKNLQELNHCEKNQPEKSTFSFQVTKQKGCENSN